MISDPMTVASGYVTTPSIPATSRETNKSVYTKTVAGTKYQVTISHQTTADGRRRSVVKLDASRVVADPYVTANNVQDTTTVALTINRSERLAADSDVLLYVEELFGALAIATFANLTTTRLSQIIGGES